MVPTGNRCSKFEAWLSGDYRTHEGTEPDQARGEEDRFRYGSGKQERTPEDLPWSRVHRYRLWLRLRYANQEISLHSVGRYV